MTLRNVSRLAFVFSVLLTSQGQRKVVSCKAKITTHAPELQMLASLGPLPSSKCSKTEDIGCSCSYLKLCQHEVITGKV